MKKILLFLLAFSLLFAVTGCKDEGIRILAISGWSDQHANIVRDELETAGHTVTVYAVEDSVYKKRIKSGDYEIAVGGWNTITGNPDYAMTPLFHSKGDDNNGINDPELDQLLERASVELEEDYINTYQQAEQLLLDKGYILPLYANYNYQAYNNNVLKESSIRKPVSRGMALESLEYNDSTLNNTRPLNIRLWFSATQMGSFDPIKKNDGTNWGLNTNQYIRLVNLTDDDSITKEASLSLNYGINEVKDQYYFVIKNDTYFATLDANKNVIQSDLVTAEDVKFSLERAKNRESVKGHGTSSLHKYIEEVSIITQEDYDELSAELKATLAEGITGFTVADTGVGSGDNYQVVRVTSTQPFPQILNYLAHPSAGIVKKSIVGDDQDAYGTIDDTVTDAGKIYASGPYIVTDKDDLALTFTKNPYYLTSETENQAKIKTIVSKYVPDNTAAKNALESGELDFAIKIAAKDFEDIQNIADLTIDQVLSNRVFHLSFNLTSDSFKELEDRLAIAKVINYQNYIAVIEDGRGLPIASPVTPLLRGKEGYTIPTLAE